MVIRSWFFTGMFFSLYQIMVFTDRFSVGIGFKVFSGMVFKRYRIGIRDLDFYLVTGDFVSVTGFAINFFQRTFI
jgi:hypothetical protein